MSRIISLVLQNPIWRVRSLAGLTLAAAAEEAHVNLQAFFLQEQGTYPNLLPTICAWLVSRGEEPELLELEYHDYQREKREKWGSELGLIGYAWGEPRGEHPFVEFRESLGLSRMAFAKHFCVHTSSLYRVEHSQTIELPHQLVEALTQAGLCVDALSELVYRMRETNVVK